MSEIEFEQEDQEALEALARLDDPDGIFDSATPSRETRAYTELLGLLPYSLDPLTPRAAVRRELLARIAARSVASESSFAADSETGVGAAVVPFPSLASPPPPVQLRSFSVFRYAAAAMLTICLLGLGYFVGKAQEQGATIARLEEDLRSSQMRAEVANFSSADLEQLERRFKMVTEVARSAYPMHRVADDATGGGTQQINGTVFVCGQHQRWYMNVQGLEPPPPEHEYHLWFVTDDGMIDGGAVELEGDTAELDASQMPRGTHGFALTLETAGSHAEPEGELVLVADHSVSL